MSAFVELAETEGPVIITRNGKAVAVLLALRDDDVRERLVLARSPRLRALLEASRDSLREGKGLSRDAFWGALERGDDGEERAED